MVESSKKKTVTMMLFSAPFGSQYADHQRKVG